MTISELSSLFENAKKSQPWAQNMSFEDFAAEGARATGDPELYRISQAGPIENTLRGWNQGLTSAVNSTPLDELLGRGTSALGSVFGINPDTAYSVGASLPRQVVNLAPMLIPGPGWLTTAGMIAGSGLSAADTYDQTGSTWQAGISAIAPAVVSKAMSAGGNAVLNAAAKSPAFQRLGVTGVTKLPGRFTDQTVSGAIARQGHKIEEDIVKGFANKAVRYAGAEAAGQAAGLGLDVAAQGTDAVFNRDYLFANVVGNLAFAPMDAGDFIGTKVVASRDVFPDKAPDVRSPAEQRAFDFEKMIAELDPAEQSRAKKAAGMDIASQLIQERRLAGLEDKFEADRTTAKESFATEWEALRQANPNLPELKVATTTPEAVSFELFPEANLKLNDYKEKLKAIDGEEKAAWSQAMMRPNLESLQGVAIDELRLPEILLNKPVEQRTLKDYQDALVDKVRDRGIKALYSIHKIAAGQEVELQARGVAEEVKKLFAEEPTKFAEDRSFVAMALWATGKKPRAEKVVEAKVKTRVDEGATVKEALSKETKTDVKKVVRAKRGADKQKRKVNEKVTARVESIEQEAMAAGLAVDNKKATPDQKVLVDAYRYASEQSGGDATSFRAMLSSLGKIWVSGMSAVDKLKSFKASVNTIKANIDGKAKETVGLPKETMTEADVQEARLEVDEDGEVVVEEILDEESAKEIEDATAIAHDRAVEKEMLRLVMDYKDLGIEQAREVLNTLSPKMTQALWKTAEENLKIKSARNTNELVPQVGLQQLMTFDKWTDVLLADQGFDAREVTQLKEHFAKVVEIFYSPEVKYGFLDEFPLESKLAKGYVGVVGENGVRWRYGELNQMVHDDTPDTRPRLGETKFRYRDDTQTLYKWGHITEVEMENIRAKLEKLGKPIKFVKLITQSNIAEAHGITTFFGPESGQKMKWARASAGGGFDFALGEVQGGKLLRLGKGAVTLAKDGTLTVQELKVAGGQFGPLQDGEVLFYKQLVPEAFTGDRVNVKLLWEKLNTLGEQVKIVTYGQDGQATPEKARIDELYHLWWENLTPGQQDTYNLVMEQYNEALTPQQEADARQRLLNSGFASSLISMGLEHHNLGIKLARADANFSGPRATSYYNQISPFDTKKFPVLRVDVVLLNKLGENQEFGKQEQVAIQELQRRNYSPVRDQEGRIVKLKDNTTGQEVELNKLSVALNSVVESANEASILKSRNKDKEITLWQQDNLHENLPNTLGWAMVQIVPDPKTGEKVMFVGEAQSRWAQEQRKHAEQAKKTGDNWYLDKVTLHPLLPIHQNLILKSVIKEAQKQGISKVAISDGETAMMTEGHDRSPWTKITVKETPQTTEWLHGMFGYGDAFKQAVKLDQGVYSVRIQADRASGLLKNEAFIKQELAPLKQEGGMRLAYDTTMPSIMKKLVGEGEMRDFGVHKNAYETGGFMLDEQEAIRLGTMDAARLQELIGRGAKYGSSVFRNPDGTPKTNITARVYDITAPSERVNTLFARKPVPGGQVYAAAIEAKRQIFLNPKALEGLSPLDRVRVQASLLAHESSHILIDKARKGLFGPDAQAIISNMDLWASSANPHEIEVVVDTMADVFLDRKTRDLPGVADVIKNLRDKSGSMDKDEVLANMYGIWATGLHQLKDPGRFYTFMPKVVRDVFDWISEKVQGVVRAAQMYVRFGGDQEKLKRVQQVRGVFAAVRKGARQAEENLGELNQLVNLSQTDIFDLADAKFAQGVYGSTGKLGASVMNKIDSWVVRQGSLAATHEGLQKPFRAMVDAMPLINDLTAQAYAGLGWGDYSHTGLNVKKNSGPARIRDSESLNKTMSKINVELQKLMETAVVEKPDGTVEFDIQKLSPELRGEVMSYNPEAQRIMAEYVIRRSKQTMPIVHGTIVKAEWDKQTDNLHKILFRYESMKMDYKLAEVVASEAMQAVRQGDLVKLAEVLKKVPSPTEAEQIGEFVTAMGQRIQKLEADYKQNPAFGSLRRFQPIKQKWTKGSEEYNMQARNAKDAEAQAAKLEAEGWTPGIPRIADYKPTDEWVMDSASKKRLVDMETRLHDALENLGIPSDVKEELKKDMNFVTMLEEDAAGKSVFSTQVKRNFAEGTDRLNVLEQDLTFVHSAISGALKRALDAKVAVSMLNPDLDSVKDAKDIFQQGYENFKSSNNPWLGKLSKANASWFIGLNLPGHIAELMQPVMTHLAEMRNIGLRTGQALGVLQSATKDVVAFYKRNAKKFASGQAVHLWDDWSNQEEREMLFELKHVINANPLNYAFDEIGFKQQQLISMTEGGGKKSLAELAMSPATAYGNWSLKFYNLFTRHNAIMGLLGGYRAYRQAGFSHAEAKEKVRLYEVVVNKSGGRADRQAAPFKGNAVLGHLFYGLQGYTTGWFSQALTYARHGYNSKNYEGFKDNPVAAKNARAALHTMLGAQLAASGIIGMPFVGALIALAEDMFGEDIRGEMYENLETVTGDPLLAQAASHGVAAALADKLGIPADLHGRFAIGGFLGFNAYDGFSTASLLGPTASMINGMWKMGETFADEHDVRKALASGGPTGIRNIAKALDQELPASDDSPIATALGFKSTQARKEIEFERIAKLRNEKAAREISHAARRVQENLGRGSAVVQQIVMTEAKKLVNSDNPQELKQVISKIGSKVRLFEEQKRFPQDLREVGASSNNAELANVARSMGVQLPQSQEVDREMMKSELYQMMGMPYRSRVKDALERDLMTQQDSWMMR